MNSFLNFVKEFLSFERGSRQATFHFEIAGFGSFGVFPLHFNFWIATFILLSLQTLINIVVATIVYYFIVQAKSQATRQLVGFGVLVPILVVTPLYLCSFLELTNMTIMLCVIGAIPNVLTLRVSEATQGLLPAYATESLRMTLCYFAAPLQIKFDHQTRRPIPFTQPIFYDKLRIFVSVFCQTSVLYSVLIPFDYEPFPHRPIDSLLDLFYWGNLANRLLMASLTSLVFEGGASGLGLMTSLCTGYTLENFSDSPLTQSTSPSDFWGRRWDRPVQGTLRRGCYLPLLNAGYSQSTAALVTFVVSGFIHEYVLLLMSLSSPNDSPYEPAWGKQFFFFLWNAIVLLMERLLVQRWRAKSTKEKPSWTSTTHIPKPFQTAFVLMTVLPIANFFTDEYIRSGFYDDSSWAFPLLVYTGPAELVQ